MTGEMHASEVTRDTFPTHFAIAEALGGSVKPFDQYQGPYVVIGTDIRIGTSPYACAPRGLGIVRLWLCSDDGVLATVYNEATDAQSEPFFYEDTESAIAAACEVTQPPRA